MTSDLDALIAEARNRGEALRTLFPNDGDIRDDARLYETLADALESTLSELRQERERADELEASLTLAGVTVSEMLSALSRAEEAIKKVLEIRRTSNLTSAEMVYKMFRILTEYGKQKGQGQ